MYSKAFVSATTHPLDVTIVGGGMITNDQILPSIYHLQRLGVVGAIGICALNSAPLRALRDNAELRQAFPSSGFDAYPSLSESADRPQPDLYKTVIGSMRKRQVVIVAVPDAFHEAVIRQALEHDQHVLSVKPLVQRHAEAVAIGQRAREKGLFVGIEYHKRFDRRAMLARRQYAEGRFGEFMMGEARLHEPYAYRHSNFQNWFTCDQADPFTYVGCHYVDLVYFITGLAPVSVSVDGVRRKFPNGNEGYLWSSGRIRYENGALLTVTNGLGYPDAAAGSNDQGLVMYCEGPDRSGMIHHDDHDRGTRYAYLEPAGAARYRYVSPDYFRLVPWPGEGYQPVGYGYDSIAAMFSAMQRVESAGANLDGGEALRRQRAVLREIDAAGILATPGNSAVNELVIEAARTSILHNGTVVDIGNSRVTIQDSQLGQD
jgi:D-galacturonate reductase